MKNLQKLLILFSMISIGYSVRATTTDTIPSLIPQDTVFINATDDNNFTCVHKIEKSETLYSISKHYGLTLNDLYFFNPNIVGNLISPGQKLNIPLPKKSILRFQSKNVNRDTYYALCYVVKKGDTAYNIARTRFKMPVDTLLERNSVITHNLDVGQVLHVGYLKKSGIPSNHHNFNTNPDWNEERLKELAYKKGTSDREEFDESGAAYLKKELKDRAGHSVLHRTAKIRSFITIKNPMNGKTVRAKVLGRIPKSVHTNDVIVVVSRQTAKALGAKDNRFFVWVKK